MGKAGLPKSRVIGAQPLDMRRIMELEKVGFSVRHRAAKNGPKPNTLSILELKSFVLKILKTKPNVLKILRFKFLGRRGYLKCIPLRHPGPTTPKCA